MLVGRTRFELVTNGLKVLTLLTVLQRKSTFFSVGKKWCASFSIVATVLKLRTLREGIFTIPLITFVVIASQLLFATTKPAILNRFTTLDERTLRIITLLPAQQRHLQTLLLLLAQAFSVTLSALPITLCL